MTMLNPDYWTVRNLEFGYAQFGVMTKFTTLGHQGLIFENLYIHDLVGNLDGLALDFRAGEAPVPNSSQWVVKDVTVSNVAIQNTNSYGLVFHTNDTGPANTYQNITIRDNVLTDIALKAIVIYGMKDSRIYNNYLNNVATSGQGGGTTGAFLWLTSNLVIANNSITNVPNTGSPDQTAIDSEGKNDGTKYRGNFFGYTAGPGLEFLQCNCPVPDRNGSDYNTNNEVSSNAFASNATANGDSAAIWSYDQTSNPTGTISNNLYATPNLTTGGISGFTLSNNVNVSSASNLYSAAYGFSATQGTNNWTYVSWAGSGGSANLSYDSSRYETWGSAISGEVHRFYMLPSADSATWTYRVWTAPSTGTIAVRGRVFKADSSGGDGVRVAITKNGAIVWPVSGTPQTIAYNDQTGFETNLDAVSVTAGDQIAFAINNNASNTADGTSWSPTVAYTATAVALSIADSSFESPAQNLFAYGPINGSSWSFGTRTGIQRNGSAWLVGGGSNAPDGAQAAFVQDGTSSSCFSQAIGGFVAGRAYSFTFSAAQRGNGQGGQSIGVYIDSASNKLGSYTPSSTTYSNITTSSITPGAGTHTLIFCGEVLGDRTAFIDNIRAN